MSNADEQRWRQRLENFSKAMARLEAACAQEEYSDLERAGLIQVFEFSFELAWKTLKDLLYFEGFEEKSPRGTFRRAFQAGYLDEDDTELFLDALDKRNLLAHIYDEDKARDAEALIVERYEPVLRRLLATLEGKSRQ